MAETLCNLKMGVGNTLVESKGGHGSGSTKLFSFTADLGADVRQTVSRTSSSFTTTKPCIVFGSIISTWAVQSAKATIHGTTLSMTSNGTWGSVPFAWLLPEPGTYTLKLSASVSERYSFYAGYFELS